MGVLGRLPPDLSVCKMGIMLAWGRRTLIGDWASFISVSPWGPGCLSHTVAELPE